jgi:hypothetical protein
MFSVGVFCLQGLEKIQSALASIYSLVIVPQMSMLSFLESQVSSIIDLLSHCRDFTVLGSEM